MEEKISGTDEKTRDDKVKILVDSAKKWVIKNNDKINFDNDGDYFLSLSDLKKTEFLDDKTIIDPSSGEEMNGCIYINLNDETSKFTYDYVNSCERIDTTSTETCFIFDNGTIRGYNSNKTGCTTTSLVIPTSVDGIKVKSFSAPTDNSVYPYQKQAFTELDFSHAFFLESIGSTPFSWNSSISSQIISVNLRSE